MNKSFDKYSKYYDLLYKDKDYNLESDYIITLLKENLIKYNNILELGSGSGNHAKYLTENGINIVGIEKSESMVEEAKQKNINNFTPIVGDIVHFQLNKKFDAAISMFHVISYLNENNAIISCLNSVNDHLNVGGIFIFDIWFSPAVYSQKPSTKIRRLNDNKTSIIRIAESNSNNLNNVVAVNFEVIINDLESNNSYTINETHHMRHFSFPELDLLAKHTGFELIKAEEFLTSNMPSENTWGVCVIFKKK